MINVRTIRVSVPIRGYLISYIMINIRTIRKIEEFPSPSGVI